MIRIVDIVFLINIIASICVAAQNDVSMPLLDNIGAPLMATLDVSNLNKQLERYIKQEIAETNFTMREDIANFINEKVQEATKIFKDMIEKPAFSASLTPQDVQIKSSNEKIRFDKVWTNIGNGYDPSSGIFTAPRNGLYYFSCSVQTTGSEGLAVQINRNDEPIVVGFATYNHGASSTMTTVITLKIGDKVFVKNRVNKKQTIRGNNITNFSGYMLQ